MNHKVDDICRKLLIIDDEAGIRRMMSLDLSAEGYEVFTAENGERGLAIFEKEQPQVVLTDLKMPGMDGIEVLRRIKDLSPDTEVIVITGHGDMDLAIESLQLRASDFITKPIHNAALEVALSRAHERLRLKAELRSYTEDLERRVEEATAKVLAAERLAAIGQTVSALAHTIKNLLVGLRGGVYLIRQGLDTEPEGKVAQGLEMLERNLSRVKRMVIDLLTISKPREPEFAEQDAAAILDEAVGIMESEAKARNCGLEVEPHPSDIKLNLDRHAILDCLCNLICNALDSAATVDGGRARLGVETTPDEVAFVVDDNGPGLDAEAEKHIFEGFYSSKGAAGTGLGLMVTRKNATEHGGRIEYQNRPGEGVTFKLVLPRDTAKPAPGQDDEPDCDQPAPPVQRETLSRPEA